MKGYHRAAVLIVVLLFSVSLMSAAINILGNISDVDLDVEPQNEETAVEPAGTGEAGKGKGKLIQVEAAPGGVYPLFEIEMPPRTKYLRLSVGEVYEDGAWRLTEDHTAVPYSGEEIELNVSKYDFIGFVTFSITPLVEFSGFIPATLSVRHLEYPDTLDRYPTLEAFYTQTPIPSTYWVSYEGYEFSEETLRAAELRQPRGCLGVPEELSDRLRPLALEIVGDASTPWEQLKALEDYLRENYSYDEDYDPAPPGVDPVEWFLFNTSSGVCTHFNSAFVLLARSIGLPARIVHGFLIKPKLDYQFVMARDAHVWAEVPFRELGWVTFDATPERMEEKPSSITRTPTVTNITYNDPVGIKGGHFEVHGTVTTLNGSAVDGVAVEVFRTVSKNETGVRCGRGEVREGFFNITCEAAADLEVGPYMLVAHALGNARYQESWSDPPIKIVAATAVTLDVPSRVYVGESVTLEGRLIEQPSGRPVANMTVVMEIGNETVTLITDGEGRVSLVYSFDAEGNVTVALRLEDTDYYLGSSGIVGIAVTAPPSPHPGLLDVLTIYPYNLVLAAACAASIAAVILVRRRGHKPLPGAAEEAPPIEVVEGDLSFDSYKEGIVKLFNRFYASTQRRYGEIRESMTPREFQRVLLGKIPEKGAHALEDLVTAFEIANYSEARPTEEDYNRCRAAVEMLRGLMEHG